MAEGTAKAARRKPATERKTHTEPHTAKPIEQQLPDTGKPQESSAETAPERSKAMEKAAGDQEREGRMAAENVTQAVAERAAEAAQGSGLAGTAARERIRAAQNADRQAAGQRTEGAGGVRRTYGAERDAAAGGSYIALHAMVRDGHSVHPGESVTFRPDEGEHVLELLAQKVIVSAKDTKAAAHALAQADLARAEAVQGSTGGF